MAKKQYFTDKMAKDAYAGVGVFGGRGHNKLISTGVKSFHIVKKNGRFVGIKSS